MGNAQKSAKYLYLSLLGALAVLCIAAGIWWFIRGQQRAEPQYLLKDNGGHPALYTIDGSGPLARYDEIYTRLLPEGDALALQQGDARYRRARTTETAGRLRPVKREIALHGGVFYGIL